MRKRGILLGSVTLLAAALWWWQSESRSKHDASAVVAAATEGVAHRPRVTPMRTTTPTSPTIADDTGTVDPSSELPPFIDPPMTAAEGMLDITVRAGEQRISGAAVRLYWKGRRDASTDETDWRLAGQGRTSTEGTLSLPARAGTYIVSVRAEGYAVGEASARRVEGEPRSAIEVRLQRAELLRVRVMEKGSPTPVPLAEVTLEPQSQRVPHSELLRGVADPMGRVQFATVASGLYRLRVRAPGFARGMARVTVPSLDEVRIDLAAGGNFEGIVVDQQGAPVTGAEVLAIGDREPWRTTTGSAGTFSLEVPPNSYTLTARSGPNTAALPTAIWVASGQTKGGLRLQLGSASAIAGTVKSAASGAPIEGVLVAASPFGESGDSGRTYSKADGSFRIDGLPPGSFDLDFAKDGLTPEVERGLTVRAGETFMVEEKMHGTSRVAGRVTTLEGTAVVGATVRMNLDNATGRTDPDGRYLLSGVAIGEHSVSVTYDGDTVGVSKRVVVREQQIATVDFQLAASATLTGRVLDSRGQAVANATVIAFRRGGSFRLDDPREPTNERGEFEQRLPPGNYSLLVTPATSTAFPRPSAQAELRAGESKFVELRLSDNKEPEIAGRVLEPDGAAAVNALVSIRGANNSAHMTFNTDEEGHFAIERRPAPGQALTLVATRLGRRGELAIGADAATRDLVIGLKPGGALRGTIRRQSGKPVSGFFLALVDSDRPNWGGGGERMFQGDQFELLDAPAGHYEVRVRVSEGGTGSAPVQLESGGDATVEVLVQAPCELVGILVSKDARRLEEAAVWIDQSGEDSAEVAADGRFRFGGTYCGEHTLTYMLGDKRGSKRVKLVSGTPLDVGELTL